MIRRRPAPAAPIAPKAGRRKLAAPDRKENPAARIARRAARKGALRVTIEH